MENIYSTLRRLKERVSPSKSKEPPTPNASEVPVTTRKRKHSSEGEDPFQDKITSAQRVHEVVDRANKTSASRSRYFTPNATELSLSAASPFIKNNNLARSMSNQTFIAAATHDNKTTAPPTDTHNKTTAPSTDTHNKTTAPSTHESKIVSATPNDSNDANTTKVNDPFYKAPPRNLNKELIAVSLEPTKPLKPTNNDHNLTPTLTPNSKVRLKSKQLTKIHKDQQPPPHVDDESKEEDEVSLEVLEEMSKLEECFPVLASNYRLIDKIGEGTFSSVYKAQAVNGSVKLGSQIWKSPPLKRVKRLGPASSQRQKKNKNPIVALKQIYVTSSPNRIHNELNLLYILTGNSHVAPLLDVLRYQDQVVAILPYYQHADFRDFYRDLPIKGIKKYLWELFQGLEFVHDKGVIHRDLKPTNFLYDPFKGKGVLVDFGLAEKVPSQQSLYNSRNTNNLCPCQSKEKVVINRSHQNRLNVKAAYPKQDQRPPRRANRAGTRGFRAPEVLFKCTNQNTKLDIWSAGIIGLSLLTRKFPLFNSPDDIDALLELTLIFGLDKMTKCAEIHGCGFEVNLPHIQQESFNGNLIKLVLCCLKHEWDNETFPSDSVVADTLKYIDVKTGTLKKPALTNDDVDDSGHHDEYESLKHNLEGYNDLKQLIQLLYGCFQMDPSKRLSAGQILKLPFFAELIRHQDDEVIL